MKKIAFSLACSLLTMMGTAQINTLRQSAPNSDASSNCFWSIHSGSTYGSFSGFRMAIDDSSNTYVFGQLYGTIDFDPGPATHTLNVPSGKTSTTFVCKYDSSGNFKWVAGFPCSQMLPAAIALDANANVHITGYFSDTVDFDPGPLVYNVGSTYGKMDLYTCKLTRGGNFVWVARQPSNNIIQSNGIAIDEMNNVYTTGGLAGTADFDPGAGTYNLSSSPFGGALFVSKLNSSGNFCWARVLSTDNSPLIANSVCSDKQGGVYLGGSLDTTDVDFDPGPGTFSLSSTGQKDAFILKLDTAGNFIWAKAFGEAMGDQEVLIVKTDKEGNVYAAGHFANTVDLDPGPSIDNHTGIIFTSKFNSAGNFLWAIDEDADSYGIVNIEVDKNNNLYLQSDLSQTTDLDPGVGVYSLTPIGNGDVYICKFDSLGSFKAAESYGGPLGNWVNGTALAVDVNLNIFVTGSFQGTIDFDPSAGTDNITSYASVNHNDLYVSRLCSSGLAVGIQNTSKTDRLAVYPNPSSGLLTVDESEMPFNQKTIEIRSVLGEVMYRSAFYGERTTIDVQKLARGTYFLSISSEGQTAIKKIVIE